MKTKHARARTSGFSLIELMIVVAITGILAATAIPTFITYIYKSRTSEAVSFLGVIKLRQAAYESEFGQYLTCIGGTMGSGTAMSAFGTASNFVPPKASSSPRDLQERWVGDTCFNTLGASPDGPVRFRYAWIAGTPAMMPSDVQAALGLGSTVDHYWVAQAHADLDDDGNWCVYELSSFTRNIWVGDTSGNDLPAGWE